MVIDLFGVESGVVAAAVSTGACVGAAVGDAVAAGAVFELAAVFELLFAGGFGAKKYDQPIRITIERAAAIKKRD